MMLGAAAELQQKLTLQASTSAEPRDVTPEPTSYVFWKDRHDLCRSLPSRWTAAGPPDRPAIVPFLQVCRARGTCALYSVQRCSCASGAQGATSAQRVLMLQVHRCQRR
jgi:hypothetical protein